MCVCREADLADAAPCHMPFPGDQKITNAWNANRERHLALELHRQRSHMLLTR